MRTMAPRLFHAQWFGTREMPTHFLDTWRHHHPDYEFRIRRDATGLRHQQQFESMQELNGKSDLARFEDVFTYGGVHIDMDMECVARLPDHLLNQECFASWQNEIYAPPDCLASCVIGARPNSALFREIVDQIPRCDMRKLAVDELGPGLLSRVARNHPELHVLPSRAFCPFHWDGQLAPGTSEVLGVHWWTGTRGVERDAEGRWLKEPAWEPSPEGSRLFLGAEPLVSIVVPAYGQAQYLDETLKSIEAQVFRDFDVMVVCGDQASVAVAKRHDVQYCFSAPRGLADARNVGIKLARGRLILPLDSDDMIAPDFLEKLVPLVEGHEHAIACSRVQEFGERSGQWDLSSWENLIEQNALPACALFTKSLWEAVGGYCPSVSYEDWDFWIRCQEACPDVVVTQVSEYLFRYRVHRDSLFQWDQQNNADRWWRAMIRLRHPSLYGKTREVDVAMMSTMPLPLVKRLYERAELHPGNHALRTFVKMASRGLPSPQHLLQRDCGCLQCRAENEALAQMRRA